MDYNSPIYREKYLKYKKKYMELKSSEQIAGGFSWFSSDITTKHNNKMSNLLKAQITIADAEVSKLVDNKKGFSQSQKVTVKKEYEQMKKTLKSMIENNTDIIPGVNNPDAIKHLKQIMDKKLNKLSLSEWATRKDPNESQTTDSGTTESAQKGGTTPVKEPVKGPVEGTVEGPVKGPVKGPIEGPVKGPVEGPVEGPVKGPVEGNVIVALRTLYDEVKKEIEPYVTETWIKENLRQGTVPSVFLAVEIGKMNIQLSSDKFVKKCKDTYEGEIGNCNETKIEGIKYFKTIMTKLNKLDANQQKANEKFYNTWNNAQNSLNKLAKKYEKIINEIKNEGKDEGKDEGKNEGQNEGKNYTIEEIEKLQQSVILELKKKFTEVLKKEEKDGKSKKLALDGKEINMENIIAEMVTKEVPLKMNNLK